MKENNNINLQLISTILFIIATIVSLSITIDEKLKQNNKKLYTDKEALDISFYNRILFLIAILISLYIAISNYTNSNTEREKYKGILLLYSSILSTITSLIVLYVSYLNKIEMTLNPIDTQNTLI